MKEKHFCRCCLSEECYKDMANIYYIEHKTENYFDMLLNIFNIKISMKDTHRCLICEDCVSKLRDAEAFKTRVLNTQETLKKNPCWNDNSTVLDNFESPNIEVQPGSDFDDFDDTLSDKFNDSDFVWDDCTPSRTQKAQVLVIKVESMRQTEKIPKHTIPNSNSERKSNRTAIDPVGNIQNTSSISTELDGATVATNSVASIKNANYKGGFTGGTTSMITRSKLRRNCSIETKMIHDSLEETDSDTDMNNKKNIPTVSTSIDESVHSNTKRIRVKKLKNKDTTVKQRKGNLKKTKPIQEDIPQTQLISKYKSENTLKLVLNSNLCLFESFQNKFGCIYCNTKFPEFNQLREHSLTHSNMKFLVRKVNGLRGLSCKNAEISNLKCNKCEANCLDLLELLNHLKNEHEILFHGTEHYLVPYKLENGFQCLTCDSKFKSYLRLSIHMNSHYTNNVCEMCGISFINRIGLRAHVHAMHTEKKCPQCPAVFLTNASKTKHLRQVHNFQNFKRYCNLCDRQFRYTYLLEKHKIQEHGFKRQLTNCLECGKSFLTAANLKIHYRSVHIRERNHPCSKCGMRFFTKCDQKRHERSHENIRSFSCSYCEAKFKSKDSWRRHMKRQHGHVFGDTS